MQGIIFAIHILGALLSVYLYLKSRRWRYISLMFLLSNSIGVLFYIFVLVQYPNRHDLSLYRSLAEALLGVIVVLGLTAEGDK